jgi:aldehyde:ferredoxin oxidoreductase
MQPILRVDLSNNRIDSFTVPSGWELNYIGGASLAARILYDSLTVDLDPLSPSAPLLCMTGPLTGTAAPTVGRFVVCAKSPATGLWGESHIGGFWGPELRMAGWDGVFITGRAPHPVVIQISDDLVEIKPASHLWGQDTYKVQDLIKSEFNDAGPRVLAIGSAGESLIPFSLMLCDHGRVAGRTGMGAVMGSKNLKAIAVKGTKKIPVNNSEQFAVLRGESNRALKNDSLTHALTELGTASAADYFDYLGLMPKKYFSAGTLENSNAIAGSSVAETILSGKSACHACVVACGRVVTLEDGNKRKGPEYETLVGFGTNLGITDTHAITRMGELCDRYGLDSISTSGVIGLAFRLFEMGIINTEITQGLELNWGNASAADQLIRQIAKREGIGALLAKGTRAFARHFGAEDEAIQVNGLELAYHDPRGASGMAVVYATSPRGACHNQSDYFLAEIGQVETKIGLTLQDRHAGGEKSANIARHQDWRTLYDSLIMCLFGNIDPDAVLKLVNLACDTNLSLEDLMAIGERGWNLKRMINHQLGLTKANDRLPKPLLRPLVDGGSAGFVPDFYGMMEAYYLARGWNPETGIPSKEKLDSLGLGWTLDSDDKSVQKNGAKK